MPDDGLYKPKDSSVWYGRYRDGQKADWGYRSTRCRDRAAARIIRDGWEREAADPRAAAAARATLSDAIEERHKELQSLASATPPRKSQRTVEFFVAKAGHLIRILEHDAAGEYVPLKLSALEPPHGARLVDQYIAQRRAEWAVAPKRNDAGELVEAGRRISDHTIAKELVCLRGALKVVKRYGLWTGDIDAVLPVAFAPNYEPGKRWYTRDQVERIIAQLTPDRGARVALMVGAGAEQSATDRAARGDADADHSSVHVRGSKRKTRDRRIPLVFQWQRDLVKFAFENGAGDGLLFEPWSNIRRDLASACARAGVAESCSPNDLRRTCLTWMRAEGMMPSEIAPFAGHADSRMVEKVYAKLNPEQLRAVMLGRAAAAVEARSSTGCPESTDSGGSGGLDGQQTEPQALVFTRAGVPGGGIEPPTRGFSVLGQMQLTSRKDERTIAVRRLALVRAAGRKA